MGFSVGDVILDNQQKQALELKNGEHDWRVIAREIQPHPKKQALKFENGERNLRKTAWNANEFHPSARQTLNIKNVEKEFRKMKWNSNESRLFIHGFQPPVTRKILENSLLLFLKNFNLHSKIQLIFKPNLFPNGKQRIFGFLYIYGQRHKEAAVAIAHEKTFELYDTILTIEYPRCKKRLSD